VARFDAEKLARRRAVLSQHVELVFPLPAEDVVLMGRYPHYGRAPSSRDREIVSRALELVGMGAKRAQPYPTLSSGEQQKTQLARVLAQIWNFDDASEHKYLFLDEPTSTLDIHFQIHLLDVARDLLQHNCTVIAILHDLNLALQYGDAFFVLDSGRLVAELESAEEISRELIERVFRVRAHRIADPADGRTVWRFEL
jgi:heme transport system ATP-binding protein